MNIQKDLSVEATNATAMALFKEERINLSEEEKGKIVEELKKAMSGERVRDEPHVTAFYRGAAFSGAAQFFNHVIPDIVVYPKSKEEVQKILSIASKHKVPITVTQTQNLQFGNRPLNGGIVIDTSKLQKIHKIDTQHGYAVVEPGVTLKQLADRVRPLGYTIAKGNYPASMSVVVTFAPWFAMHNFANRMNQQVIGLEMVTPDGSTIYTGNKVYKDSEFWTDVQNSCPQLTNLFIPSYATTGVITSAAVRIWPLLEETALPMFGFDDFESAFRWSQYMAKSSMTDQTMVWNWVTAGSTNFRKTERDLDMLEARMTYFQDETPESVGLYNCYGFVQVRGFKEEVEGAVKAAKRIARQYGGKYVPEKELKEKLPTWWSYLSTMWKDHNVAEPGGTHVVIEGQITLGNITGPTEEIIKSYKYVTEKVKEFGYKNVGFYTRMFNGGQTPWYRFFPVIDTHTQEEILESQQMMDQILDGVLNKYDVNLMYNDFMFNDPENPENVRERAKPNRRIMSAVQKEFDPEGIMTPFMKKYSLK